MQKKELDIDTLDLAVGGSSQANKKGSMGSSQANKEGSMGVQIVNKTGNNNVKNIQKNNIENNKGSVKVGGPVSIETGNNSKNNINIS